MGAEQGLVVVSHPSVVVVGLGYVGLPLAVALARYNSVIGLDIDRARIDELRNGCDRTGEIVRAVLDASSLALTDDPSDCIGAEIYIVTVPTPVDDGNRPDLGPLEAASRAVGTLIRPGKDTIVVFESTVYPGVTEDVCQVLLEQASGLKCGEDFFLGYSPERINPGDRVHTVDRIVKVVAGQTPQITERLAALYGSVTQAGIYKAASIKVAEAAKVIENAQRDINIAFMNEISRIFSRMGLSVWDVLDAARTKWNFLGFRPGLVGGHCIGVDPYYLSYSAQRLGYEPAVVLAGRVINDTMGAWVAERMHEHRRGKIGTVLVLGLTFKENVPDLRNSRVMDVIRRLEQLGHHVAVHDPLAGAEETRREYGIDLQSDPFGERYDLVFLAVAHDQYVALPPATVRSLVADGGTIADLPGIWREIDFGDDISRWGL